MVWRWHFYAGMIVAPVLVVMAVTGGVYIFKAEVEELARRDVMFVSPRGERVGYEAQLDTALTANPGFVSAQVQSHNDTDLAAIFTLRPGGADVPAGREGFRRQISVYVDPYTGRVIGSVAGTSSLNWFIQTVLSNHRTLWAGAAGRVITELVTSWSIVLPITGVDLWWP